MLIYWKNKTGTTLFHQARCQSFHQCFWSEAFRIFYLREVCLKCLKILINFQILEKISFTLVSYLGIFLPWAIFVLEPNLLIYKYTWRIHFPKIHFSKLEKKEQFESTLLKKKKTHWNTFQCIGSGTLWYILIHSYERSQVFGITTKGYKIYISI